MTDSQSSPLLDLNHITPLISYETLTLSTDLDFVELIHHYLTRDDTSDTPSLPRIITLVLNHIPSPLLCNKIGDYTADSGVELLTQCRTVIVTEQALHSLLLSSSEYRCELSTSLEGLSTIASPDRVEVASIDNLLDTRRKRPSRSSWSPTAYELVDKLVSSWLKEALESLVIFGQYHRVHPYIHPNSKKLVKQIVWRGIYDSKLHYSALQASKTPKAPYIPIAPLKPEDDAERKIAWLTAEAYPHVHAFLNQELKRESRRKLVISCPELTPWEMRQVCRSLISEAESMIGGKADGMIGDSSAKTTRRSSRVRVIVDVEARRV
ncbi:hypothetical protein BD324DRAFT_653768 [Kockovaella imperatae]|uniref:Uncharacterized protein n=1 Tax=Kockovaella imperatae TaxID=4999 RepID=A0A1Y1U7U2_9TREE|nr:hypothetical protein BD324DRAFT_653768 [Kockovaella imperatae]ORX34078.1 hypothetical protein BD324DRAFT_653768 [Kockovaella imperatae]